MVRSQNPPRRATHSLFTTASLRDVLCGFFSEPHRTRIPGCRAPSRSGSASRETWPRALGMCDGPHYHPHVCVGVTLGVLDLSQHLRTDRGLFESHADARVPSLQEVLKIVAKESCQRARPEKQSKYVLKNNHYFVCLYNYSYVYFFELYVRSLTLTVKSPWTQHDITDCITEETGMRTLCWCYEQWFQNIFRIPIIYRFVNLRRACRRSCLHPLSFFLQISQKHWRAPPYLTHLFMYVFRTWRKNLRHGSFKVR